MRPACDNARILPKVITTVGMIEAVCDCGDSIKMPDQGLGRAAVQAWLTRHQKKG